MKITNECIEKCNVKRDVKIMDYAFGVFTLMTIVLIAIGYFFGR